MEFELNLECPGFLFLYLSHAKRNWADTVFVLFCLDQPVVKKNYRSADKELFQDVIFQTLIVREESETAPNLTL